MWTDWNSASRKINGHEEDDEDEPIEEPDQADFILFLKDHPNNPDEILEAADEKLGIGGIIDPWAQIYLAGATLGDSGPIGSAQICTAPDIVQTFFKAIHEVPPGDDVANGTICTVFDSHELAFDTKFGAAMCRPPCTEQSDGIHE